MKTASAAEANLGCHGFSGEEPKQTKPGTIKDLADYAGPSRRALIDGAFPKGKKRAWELLDGVGGIVVTAVLVLPVVLSLIDWFYKAKGR